MIERRNFYRILHIQPDASFAVIRESYRVLMQAHESRSDLREADWDFGLLNIAYKTLQDPQLRATYNRELLKRYPIKTLSQGAFGISAEHAFHRTSKKRPPHRNRRNYYRILQVQPDAPSATISATYRVLKQNGQQDGALLDEAYNILADPVSREQYDTIFSSYALRGKKKPATVNPDLPAPPEAMDHATTFSPNSYRTSGFSHCLFCDTPYVPQSGYYQHETCLECASPLHRLQHDNPETSRRLLRRIHIAGEFSFYLFWPSAPYLGIFQDLSAAGIRFLTPTTLAADDVIKIDAPNFQAVAEVTHTRNEADGLSVGTRFVAVKFDRQYGNFVSAHA